MALELPPVTLADRLAAGLAIAAGAYGATVLAEQGQVILAIVVAVAGALATASQVIRWARSRGRAPWCLERSAEGSLQVRVGAEPATPAELGPGTRHLGPSVFLEVRFASGGRTTLYRGWLTPFDVPAAVLRRWSVVLPRSGRAACS